MSFELFSLEFFSRWPKIKPVLMQNGDFGRLGPRLDLPGKKIGGGPKAQGVSKSGEFNTLVLELPLSTIVNFLLYEETI